MKTFIQNCEHCKYFIKYYMVNVSNNLVYAGCGFCYNSSVNKNLFNKAKKGKIICECWEDGKECREKKKQSVINTIYKMEETLKNLLQIINSDIFLE